MKSNTIKKLQEIYTPVENIGIPYPDIKFSHEQKMCAWNYVNDSIQTLKSLCKKVVLNVRQILITACEIVEMLIRVPSTLYDDQTIDMRSIVCSNVRRLAAFMDAYDVDPNKVSAIMIRKECDELAAYC
tara:strand:+ start:290 stop:676 length:387 start_codon:yes stop_codon:yes gene_type:complete